MPASPQSKEGPMTMRPAASRLVTLATLAALAASIVGTTAAEARSPGQAADRSIKIGQNPGREQSGVRSYRHVDVEGLPGSTGKASPVKPHLAKPKSFTTKAPIGVTAATGPTFATTNADPAITEATSIAGLASNPTPPTSTSGEPPDPWVAAGPEHVVQVVNTAFRFNNRSGAAIKTVDMFDFFDLGTFYSPGQVAYFDPHLVYDSLHQRWIAIEASFDCDTTVADVGTGYIDIAISDGPDPTLGWGVFSIGYAEALPDFPGIGTSTDKVVVSANVFALVAGGGMGCEPDDASFLGTEMDVMAWSELIGTGNINIDFLNSINNFANDFFSWRPSLQTPASSPTVFVVSETSTNDVAYARITGTPAGGGVTSISAPANLSSILTGFGDPPPPTQPGPDTIDNAVDGRPTDAIWKDNHLAFVSTVPCDPPGAVTPETRDCVRVSELNTTNATPSVIQSFLVGEDATDSYMGGIGYALNDDLHVVYTRSSDAAGQYPSSWSAYQSAKAANNSLSTRALLSAGTGNYPGTRWGDYVGVAQDPQVPNAVWQANEFSAGANLWATEVSQLQTGGSSYVPITPVRVLDTRPTYQIGLSGVFVANVPRTWTVANFKVNNVAVIPANAIAVTGNFVVVGQNAAGYAAVGPTPNPNPPTSSLNFPVADVRANNVTLPLSAAGNLSAVYKAPPGKTTHFIFDVTGYFLAGNASATYATITPTRVLDSRAAYHIGLTGRFSANVPRTLSIAGANGIPADAVAVTANLAVVNQTRAGYVAITPNPDPNPPTATMNFPAGDVRANGLTARLNGSGDLSLVFKAATGNTTDLILDITGYYRNSPSGLLFFPLTPGRIMDTRPGVALSRLTGLFTSSTPRTVSANGHFGIPVGAGAITGNLSIVGQTAGGYAVITPNPAPNPPTATINFPLGDVRGNGVTVPLNAAFDLSFVYKAKAGSKTHMILDVTGYFR